VQFEELINISRVFFKIYSIEISVVSQSECCRCFFGSALSVWGHPHNVFGDQIESTGSGLQTTCKHFCFHHVLGFLNSFFMILAQLRGFLLQVTV